MWWAIGIGVLIVGAVLLSRFLKIHRQVQLIEAGKTHLVSSFRMLAARPNRIFQNEVDKRVWSDPYLLGYAQGSLAIMIKICGSNLNTTQNGMVTVRVLQDLVGEDWTSVCERMDQLYSSRDSEFSLGMQHGGDVTVLMLGKAGPALLADPDVQKALREAPEHIELTKAVLGSSDTGPYGAAGSLLMQEYMERHAREAGY